MEFFLVGALIVMIVLALLVLASCIKIVPQAHAYIVERFGRIFGNVVGWRSHQNAVYRQDC